MWKFKWAPFYISTLYIVVLHLCALQLTTHGNARGYLLRSPEHVTRSSIPESNEYDQEHHECYITVQEIKRIGGKCVKIRDNFQGCIAGNLMDPFHQDCL